MMATSMRMEMQALVRILYLIHRPVRAHTLHLLTFFDRGCYCSRTLAEPTPFHPCLPIGVGSCSHTKSHSNVFFAGHIVGGNSAVGIYIYYRQRIAPFLLFLAIDLGSAIRRVYPDVTSLIRVQLFDLGSAIHRVPAPA